MFSVTVFSFDLEYKEKYPTYLTNYVEYLLEKENSYLEKLWGLELKFPVEVSIERIREMGAKGEAGFDGERFYLFITPVSEEIPSLLKHEFMHIFSFQWFYNNGIFDSPLWFVEGLAVWNESRGIEAISELNPISTWKESDFISIETYPQGDAFSRYYSFLSDFFFFIDREIDISSNFMAILNSYKTSGSAEKAFSLNGFDFSKKYFEWRVQRFFASLAGFIFLSLSWLLPAIFIAFSGIYILIRRKKIKDTFDPKLEKVFGERYWEKKE